jgi:NAD kinase
LSELIYIAVIKPSSFGFLKQLDGEEEQFKEGLKKMLNGDFVIQDRTILHTIVGDQVKIQEKFL